MRDPDESTGPLYEWLSSLDFGRAPASPESVWLRIAAAIAGLFAIFYLVRGTANVLASARPLPRLTADEYLGFKFGIAEGARREIFAELARAEKAERVRAVAQNTWRGHAWSREDDRGSVEQKVVRTLAGRYRVSETAIYAVLDDAIRHHWRDEDGVPLSPQTPPLDPRTW